MPKAAKASKVLKNKKNRKVNVWMILSIILIILFAAFIVYERSPNVHNGVNTILGIESDRYPVIEQVRVDALNDKSITNPSYDYKEILSKIEDEFKMEFVVTEIDINDEKGKQYIDKFQLASIPVLLFEENLATTILYEETKNNYQKQDDKYILQLQPYKYLTLPNYDLGHKRGAENPKVTIVEFSSLSCGYCGKMKPILAQILEEYPNDVQLVYKQFNRGGIDMLLENASECAGEQGKFWEFHDYIFDNQASVFEGEPADVVKDGAAAIGLNKEQFDTCVTEQKFAQTVNDHTAEGYKFGVNGTPTFFVNDKFIGGAVSYETLKQTVDSLIQ
jgi:protein-disulfide isomerase